MRDTRALQPARPFTVREVANLHGFPSNYHFLGPLNERYDMVIDSVMPPIAHAIGLALNAYFEAIPAFAKAPISLGYREILSPRQKRQQMEEALALWREPEPGDGTGWAREAEQMPLWN